MNTKVSIVMPCLNVVSYIQECLESVINQSYKDLEILVIDAGSTDGTLDVLRHYEEQDSRVKIIHSEKKSYGYQMNLGIRIAKGEYIAIIETDDVADKYMIEKLYFKACENNVDYVKGTAKGFYVAQNGSRWEYNIYPCAGIWEKEEMTFCPENTPELFWTDNFLWYGLYKATFLKKIQFHETPGAAFQDIGALFQIISSAEKGIYINYPVYNYRRSNADASSYNKKSVNFAAVEYQYIYLFLQDKSPEWVQVYYEKMLGLCLNRFDFMAGVGEFWQESMEGINIIRNEISNAIDRKQLCLEKFIRRNSSEFDTRKRVKLLLEDPHSLFDYDLDKFKQKQQTVKKVKDFVQNKKTIIFGAGVYGKFIHMYLLTHNQNVVGYCDNSPELWGKMIQGIPVISPIDITRQDPEMRFVIANKRHADEIFQQLINMGINNTQVYIYQDTADIFLLMQ